MNSIIHHTIRHLPQIPANFAQAISSLNNKILAAAAIALACLAAVFVAWMCGCCSRRGETIDPQTAEKKKQQELEQKEKGQQETVDKINSEGKIWLSIDKFLELAKTKGEEITSFDLAIYQDSLTNDQLKEVVRYCPNLTHVKISSKKVDSDGLAALVLLSKLEGLDLSHCRIHDAELARVGLLIHLKELNLQLCDVTAAGAAEIAKCTALQRLDLGNCFRLTDQCLEPLSALTKLQVLNLKDCQKVTDKGMEHLAHLPLEELNLKMCAITDKGLDHIGKMRALRSLVLFHHELKGPGFIHLVNLSHLRVLDLSGCTYVSDQALEYIGKLPALEELSLAYAGHFTALTSQGIGLMATKDTLPLLRKLNMHHVEQLYDQGVSFLAMLQSLEELDLSDCKQLTDHALVYLAVSAKKLKVLNLSNCEKITDKGIEYILSNTSVLKDLQVVYLSDCYKISDTVKKELEKKCKVIG